MWQIKMGKIQKSGKAVCFELAVIWWGAEEMFLRHIVFAFAPYLKSMEFVPSWGIQVEEWVAFSSFCWFFSFIHFASTFCTDKHWELLCFKCLLLSVKHHSHNCELVPWAAWTFYLWTSSCIWPTNNLGSNFTFLLRQKFLWNRDAPLVDEELWLYLSILPASRVFTQSLKDAQSLEGFQASCPTKKSGQMALQEKWEYFMSMK